MNIIDCVESHPSPWFGGSFGFVLANRRKLREPISYKGAPNFWRVPESVVAPLGFPSRAA